jgi:dipeptide/tripeptide permease
LLTSRRVTHYVASYFSWHSPCQGTSAKIRLTFQTRIAREKLMERNYRSLFINIFVGSNGIRAGWRLLLFVTFFRGVAAAMVFALKCIPSFRAWRLAQDPNVLTASYQIYRGATFVAALLLAIVLMSLIEKRRFVDCYLAPKEAFAKHFWQGTPSAIRSDHHNYLS